MESNINYFSECDCDADGAVGGKKGCDSKGECKCKDGFYGPQCKSECDCDELGTEEGKRKNCDPTTGQCVCRTDPEYSGLDCSGNNIM